MTKRLIMRHRKKCFNLAFFFTHCTKKSKMKCLNSANVIWCQSFKFAYRTCMADKTVDQSGPQRTCRSRVVARTAIAVCPTPSVKLLLHLQHVVTALVSLVLLCLFYFKTDAPKMWISLQIPHQPKHIQWGRLLL